MPDDTRKLKIVSHAYDRAKEFGLKPSKVAWLFWNSVPEPTPPGKRKNGKYASTTHYWRNGTYVMVVGETDHKDTGEPIYLLLTIFDQRMYLKPKYLIK